MNIEYRVRKTLEKTLMVPEEQITPSASFADDLAISSLDRLELMMAIEEEFGIELSEDEQASIKTVNDLVEHVKLHSGS